MKIKYIPNILTAFRLAVIPFFVLMFVKSKLFICTLLFILSGLSDAVDGFIARKFNCESNVGKILDPIADKLSYATVFFCLFAKGKIPVFFIIGFVAIQLLHAVGATFIYRSKKTVVKANIVGKIAGLSMFLMCFINLAFYDKLTNPIAVNAISLAVLALITTASAAYFIEYLARPAAAAKKRPIDN